MYILFDNKPSYQIPEAKICWRRHTTSSIERRLKDNKWNKFCYFIYIYTLSVLVTFCATFPVYLLGLTLMEYAILTFALTIVVLGVCAYYKVMFVSYKNWLARKWE